MKFEELDISNGLLDALDCMGFETCAPIQEKAIPLVLEGRDLIAIAQTGTGKTAAYLLPVIDMITNDGYPENTVNCIVMSPTRELAQQIDRQLEGFAYYMPVTSIAVYGGGTGEEFGRQQRGLKEGADVVIATPGRLLAHLAGGGIDLSKVSFFILDEADRMLDMGFYDDIMQIVSRLPKERQTLLFSATMPPKIQQLAADILNNPAEVKIAVSRPADKIDQSAYLCGEGEKTAILERLIRNESDRRVIVFASSKLNVKDLTRVIRRKGIKVAEMHSDLEQEARDEAMLGFKSGRTPVMIATDIVARGIDIDDIGLVVNYDVPRTAEDYVHRVGRTARANAEGSAVTLVSPKDRRRFAGIEHFLGKPVRKCNPDGSESDESTDSTSVGKSKPTRNRKSHHGNRKSGNRETPKSNIKPPAQEALPRPANMQPATASTDKQSNRRRHHHRKRPRPTQES